MSILATFFFKKDNIVLELEKLEFEENERAQLLNIIEEIVELRLIDHILDKLDERDKELFLQQLHSGTVEVFAEFLREKIQSAEEIMTEYAILLEKEILEDLKNFKE